MKALRLFLPFIVLSLSACTTESEENMQDKIKTELERIDSLLRDEAYNTAMAQTLEAAYYKGEGKTPPPSLSPGKASTDKSVQVEKVAINIAGFYALECGIEWICFKTNQTPTEVLKKINDDTLDSASVSTLNRFANATWKAGQPFRDIKRITRPTFTVFNFLPAGEIKKDHDQIRTAAAKLLSSMEDVADSNTNVQMQKIRSLMQNKDFTMKMADTMHTAYYTSQGQAVPAFLTPADDTAVVSKSVRDEKIATNVAGFYALECGLNYFAAKNRLPSQVLGSIVNNNIGNEDKMLLQRFANATWKASQPFRGLDRIQRDNFIPFYFLDENEIEKDWVQIWAAAEKLLSDIK